MSVQTAEPLELQELEQRISEGHAAVLEAAATALVKAIGVGEDLLRARELVAPGEWTDWMENRFSFGDTTARLYIRVAHYQRELGDGPLSLSGARELLRDYPPVPRVGEWDSTVRRHAMKLRRDGLTGSAIAERLGVPEGTVSHWIKPTPQRKRDQRAARRKKRDAERALRKEQALTLARKRGDSLGRAYVAIRLAARELDASRGELGQYLRQAANNAHAELEAAEEAAAEALRHVYRAEDFATGLVRRSTE